MSACQFIHPAAANRCSPWTRRSYDVIAAKKASVHLARSAPLLLCPSAVSRLQRAFITRVKR